MAAPWGYTAEHIDSRLRRNRSINRRQKYGPAPPPLFTVAEIEKVLASRGFTEAEIIEWWHFGDHRMVRWYAAERWTDVYHFAVTGELRGDG